MIKIVRRILKISGKYRNNIIIGLIFSALKSFFASIMMFAVLLIMINIEKLNYSELEKLIKEKVNEYDGSKCN